MVLAPCIAGILNLFCISAKNTVYYTCSVKDINWVFVRNEQSQHFVLDLNL